MPQATPRIAITAGEPAGIGPELCVQLAQSASDEQRVIIGNKAVLTARAEALGMPLRLRDYDPGQPARPQAATEASVLDIATAAEVAPGRLNPANAEHVLGMLRRAGEGALSGEFAAIVTAPVQKSVINDAGVAFSGHTEFFAELTHTELPVMMLTADTLRVALATTHLPLRAVPDAITQDLLDKILGILLHDLRQRFGIPAPTILVCGLNPHAGEGGHMGREEIDVIEPVLRRFREQGHDVRGPLPADTLFVPRHLENAHAVLAMYHDQGLPVLKHAGFGHAVNVTLGLPIVRTSVDHGTALDLAGTGQADVGSLRAAYDLAVELALGAR